MLDGPVNVHEMSKRAILPFEINDEFATPFIDIDPDMQFCLESNYIKNTKCDYSIEDTLVKTFQKYGTEDGIINVSHAFKKPT